MCIWSAIGFVYSHCLLWLSNADWLTNYNMLPLILPRIYEYTNILKLKITKKKKKTIPRPHIRIPLHAHEHAKVCWRVRMRTCNTYQCIQWTTTAKIFKALTHTSTPPIYLYAYKRSYAKSVWVSMVIHGVCVKCVLCYLFSKCSPAANQPTTQPLHKRSWKIEKRKLDIHSAR